MSLPALEEEEEQEEEEELDLGGPVVGDLPATLFTCLLRGWANVALTQLQLIHVGVEVLVGLCLLELIAQGRGFKLHHVNLRMRHKLPVLPVRIQETTGVARRVVGPPPRPCSPASAPSMLSHCMQNGSSIVGIWQAAAAGWRSMAANSSSSEDPRGSK
jgi:hypothetical protein